MSAIEVLAIATAKSEQERFNDINHAPLAITLSRGGCARRTMVTMTSPPSPSEGRRSRLVPLGLLVIVVAFIGVRVEMRRRAAKAASSAASATADPAVCAGRLGCVIDRVEAMQLEARAARQFDVQVLGAPLVRALSRGDCAAAGEYTRALGALALPDDAGPAGRVASARDRAVLAVLERCHPTDGQAPPRVEPADATIRFSRTGCEGTCPVYTLTVRADGGLSFKGTILSAAGGTLQREGKIDPARALALFAMLDRIGFGGFAPRYEADIIDAPGAALALTRDGHTHAVVETAACVTKRGVEDGLCYAERQFEAVAEETGWVGELRAAAK